MHDLADLAARCPECGTGRGGRYGVEGHSGERGPQGRIQREPPVVAVPRLWRRRAPRGDRLDERLGERMRWVRPSGPGFGKW